MSGKSKTLQHITFEKYGPEFKDAYTLMQNFFNLPQHIKEKYKDAISTSNSTSFQICDVGYSQSGGRETFQIRTGDAGVPWPDEAAPELEGFRKTYLDTFARLQEISISILADWLANTNSKLSDKIFNAVCDFKKPKGVSASVLRLAVYNEVDVNKKILYELPHADSGVITLCVTPEEGLEVSEKDAEGPWEECNKEKKECIIAFQGTALSTLSEGAFSATHHRVKNTERKRYSLVFFLRAQPEAIGPRTEADFQIMLRHEQLSRVPEAITSQFQEEVIENIVKHLDAATLVRSISRVCKNWLKIASSDHIWNKLYARRALDNTPYQNTVMNGLKNMDVDWKKMYVTDYGYLYRTGSRLPKQMAKNTIKAVFVGDVGVGKTALITTACTGCYPGDYVPTGFDNFALNIIRDNVMYNIGCWDTAGAVDYDRLRPLSYPQTDIFVISFDPTRRVSFTNITQKWIPEIRHHCPNTNVVLCANKIDLKSKSPQEVSTEEGAKLAEEIRAVGYFETSALTGVGVRGTIEQITSIVSANSKKSKENCILS